MSRWLSVLRGMAVTGLVFGLGVGTVAFLIAMGVWAIEGFESARGMGIFVVGSAVWSFMIGMAVAGFLALTARGRSFSTLSLPRFAALGAVGGLVLYSVLAIMAWDAWSPAAALTNLVVFLVLGTGSATATLLLARRGAPSLNAEDAHHQVSNGEGDGGPAKAALRQPRDDRSA